MVHGHIFAGENVEDTVLPIELLGHLNVEAHGWLPSDFAVGSDHSTQSFDLR